MAKKQVFGNETIGGDTVNFLDDEFLILYSKPKHRKHAVRMLQLLSKVFPTPRRGSSCARVRSYLIQALWNS